MEMDYHQNPYKCRLNISVPPGKEGRFKKIVSPLMKWIDPSFQMLQIANDNAAEWKIRTNKNQTRPSHCEENIVMVPSISIMLFLYEHGSMSAADVQKCLKTKPWKFHHKVELHSKWTPDRAVAAQEFYGLADDMPLWSVCPVHCGNEHFRVLYHVQNFQKMMEFYRCVTDMEIESSKPGFCIFQLYSQPGLDIQLALKQSKNIRPYPVHNACLTFQIKHIDSLRAFLDCEVTEISDRTFLVQDPDGNYVMLQEELSSGVTTEYESLDIFQTRDSHSGSKFDSNGYSKSLRSSSDSQDSGRCSDSDIWSSEVEQIKSNNQNGKKNSLNQGNRYSAPGQCGGDVIGCYPGYVVPDNYRQWERQSQLTFDTVQRHNTESVRGVEAPVFI
ncbi:protein FAM124A-like [Mizuhopecten yessoensis]|uniref:protein FAM124A-like n=1 Tax=Mizuhopecten yessoensis TaxID=6573 RepID=UPI000B45A149|nr:protein FAM124A-like [Mizuhopecten yessoensis]